MPTSSIRSGFPCHRRRLQPRAGRDEARARPSCAVLDDHGVSHGVLVQPSGYGIDNSANLDAIEIASGPVQGRSPSSITTCGPSEHPQDLADAGVVGVRFNLASYDRGMLTDPRSLRLLSRLKACGWFAQIYADDDQWRELAAAARAQRRPSARRSFRRARHLGLELAIPDFRRFWRWAATAIATVKLSSPFRISPRSPMAIRRSRSIMSKSCCKPSASHGCLWGSDWPFINVRPAARSTRTCAIRCRDGCRTRSDRARCCGTIRARLFGFGEPCQ